ncbi:glutamate 5-kinase [Basidiobolus meristosporus CBS 931.73]|uniref:Glutamate 5-kinase n=1 Tax=Basidiobolus meristosporus CBS 931.73 TaxID=1314790 RepID=A0A1Y1YPU6_9FUNG|nr:glutamate 5-kinase [Basidiobolus meristosporus CBS 931.73]|eukprot:ORX99786.1 glutamate 5-kinase [Basidiobolus meristosporus CBS 931.73]
MTLTNSVRHGRPQGLTIVLKLGTSSICDEVTHFPLLATLSSMVETIIRLQKMGHRVVLVTSGAVGVGLRRLDLPVKPSELAKKQAIAAVGQGRLMSLYDNLFDQFGQPIAQILLTKNDLAQRSRYLNARNTFEELFNMNVIPIVNENDTVSVAEIRFGDNDTLSAITAGIIHADYLFLLTDVDCLYTDNPRTNPSARPVRVVEDIGELKKEITVTTPGSALGTGGMVTKLVAAELATAAGVTTIITHGSKPERVFEIIDSLQNTSLKTPPLFTRFVAKHVPMMDRKWWILHGLYNAGTIYVDQGAKSALTEHKSSLFAAGIVRVDGHFNANQAVRIVHEETKADGSVESVIVAKGLVNYSSVEINIIKGCKSSQFADLLGYVDSPCIVERENLARLI